MVLISIDLLISDLLYHIKRGGASPPRPRLERMDTDVDQSLVGCYPPYNVGSGKPCHYCSEVGNIDRYSPIDRYFPVVLDSRMPTSQNVLIILRTRPHL